MDILRWNYHLDIVGFMTMNEEGIRRLEMAQRGLKRAIMVAFNSPFMSFISLFKPSNYWGSK